MPNYNRTIRVKRGETGKPCVVTFYDHDLTTEDKRLDLTGHTVVFEVTATDSATNLLEGTNMTVLNQTTNKGQARYTLTSTDATIAAGTYQWEARATNTSSGRVYIAPNVDGDSFGTFIMRASKI